MGVVVVVVVSFSQAHEIPLLLLGKVGSGRHSITCTSNAAIATETPRLPQLALHIQGISSYQRQTCTNLHTGANTIQGFTIQSFRASEMYWGPIRKLVRLLFHQEDPAAKSVNTES